MSLLKREEVYSSYVGSFPLSYSEDNVKRIMRDVTEIPIDFPCYPQLEDFIEQFLHPFEKERVLEKHEGRYVLLDEEGFVDRIAHITKDELYKGPLKAAKIAIDFIKVKIGYKRLRGLRACVTGPITLASQIFIGEPKKHKTLLLESSLIEELAAYTSELILSLTDLGYDLIFIDEPILGVIVGERGTLYLDEDTILDIIDPLSRMIKPKIPGIHVCGKVSRRLVTLLAQSSFEILDFEFAGTPINYRSINKTIIEDYDKQLGVGVVKPRTPEIDSLKEIKHNMEKALQIYGVENIAFFKPDCGFRGLRTILKSEEEAYRIALGKLKNLRKALDEIRRK